VNSPVWNAGKITKRKKNPAHTGFNNRLNFFPLFASLPTGICHFNNTG